MDTFIIETDRANANAAGGKETLRFLVRAEDLGAAAGLVHGAMVRVLERGSQLENLAREHGIFDGGSVRL
jgi:hypothetical protein